MYGIVSRALRSLNQYTTEKYAYMDKEEILRHASPEFQEQVRLEREMAAKEHALALERAHKEQRAADLAGNVLMGFLYVCAAVIALLMVYGVVKFIKWAWFN